MNNPDLKKILNSLPRFHNSPGLSRIRRFVRENHLLPQSFSLIIGGTNGKGSVSSMLENVLFQSGISVGILRSPHVYSPCERISFNCRPIPGDEFREIISFVLDFFKKKKIKATISDVTTGCALLYFTRYKSPHVMILEVGMGGRLDPANVISGNISVITNIGKDHTHILGKYPEGPARAKAGIIRKGIPLFISENKPGVLNFFRDICRENGSSIFKTGDSETIGISKEGTRFIYGGNEYISGLVGFEQAKNASLTLDILNYMNSKGFEIPEKSIRKGIKSTKLPWRMEIFPVAPLVFLDGSHNREGWLNLKRTVEFFSHRNLNIILFMRKTKIPGDFPRKFSGERIKLFLPNIGRKGYQDPERISQENRAFEGEKIICRNLKVALKSAVEYTDNKDILLVVGSFGLAEKTERILSGIFGKLH